MGFIPHTHEKVSVLRADALRENGPIQSHHLFLFLNAFPKLLLPTFPITLRVDGGKRRFYFVFQW